MHLYQLELLCEIVRVKSFSKAAKHLHLSQPAVSGQIHSIEDFYGTQLFERSSTGVTLTEAGQIVYKRAKEILQLHEQLEKEIDGLAREEKQKLVIGASSVIGNYTLPCSLWNYKGKYPLVDLKLEIKNAETIMCLLTDDKINLALVEKDAFTNHENDLVTQPVTDDELIVISPSKKPWTNKKAISLEELKKAPLIIREKGSGMRKTFENVLESWGMFIADFNVVIEMGSLEAIKSTVEAGVGVAICSRVAVRKEIRAGIIHPLSIEGKSINIQYMVVYKANKKLNSAEKRFVRLLADPVNSLF